MNPTDPQLITKLNAIAASKGKKQRTLIQAFIKEHPQHKQLVQPFEQTQSEMPATGLPHIEGYEINRLIGTGASGRVYLAHTPDHEEVAIKIPNGWLSDEQLQRFKHESELLKRLSHNSIAKIYAVGETHQGHNTTPYIVMEYVNGTDIRTHCEKHQLDQRACVQLLLQVLEGIQHAHQNRVIHRDLKPTNIVVGKNGKPKIIDFGIATLADDSTQTMTQLTKTGEVIGTLSYMSPEQISGSDQLDSRSDVYSCGVILYELLVGSLPHKVNPAQFFSAVHAIVNEPIKPITDHQVAIDDSLAAVVHHALIKAPGKRFQSAHEFATDLKRWMDGEAVESQTLSKWYWVQQAAKKNKALVAGTSLAFAGLLMGLVFAISFANKEQAARALADSRSESNRKVVAFINDLFVNADPGKALGESITVKQVVNSADYAVDKKLADSPHVESQIRLILGNVNQSMERFDVALDHYNKALSLILQSDELYPILVTEKIKALGATSKFEQQISLINQAKEELNAKDHGHLLDRIEIEEAANYSVNNKLDDAIRKLLDLKQRGGLNTENTIALKKQLGRFYREKGEFTESEKVFAELVEDGTRSYGSRHPLTIDLRQELALSLRYLNRLDDAIAIYLGVVQDARSAFSDDSLTTLLVRVNLAVAYMYKGDFKQAEQITAEVLPKMITLLGPLHQYTMSTRNIRAGALDNLGRIDEAIAIYKETLNAFAQSENKNNNVALTVSHNMAVAYSKKNDHQKAAEIYQELIPRCLKQMGEDSHHCMIFADAMAEVEIHRGNWDAAQSWLDYSSPGLLNVFGPDHHRVKSNQKRQKDLNQKRVNQGNSP